MPDFTTVTSASSMRSPSQFPLSRRRLLTASAGVAAAAALPACAASVSSSSGGGGKTTVTVMTNPPAIGDTEFGTKDQIAAAEKKLGIKIKQIGYDVTKLTAMLSSGNPPDIVRGMGVLDTPYLVAHDVAQDLDSYFAKSTVLKSDDIDPINDAWRYDGSKQGSGPRYGLAKDWSQDAMFWYNTALFDSAGVKYPSGVDPVSYDEWLDLGKRLTQRVKGKTKVYGMSANGLGFTNLFSTMTAQQGGQIFNADLSAVDFTSPEAIKALNWYLEYAKANVGPTPVNPDPNGWDWPTFQARRMAMPNDGYWFGGMISTDDKIAAVSRLAPAPQFGGTRLSPCAAATGYWIAKASKNKDAAWRLFEWYFGEEPAKERAKTGTGIPGLKSLRSLLPQDKPYQKQAYEVQMNELKYFSVQSFTPYVRSDALDGVVNAALPAAIKNGTPAAKLADTLTTNMNKQLAQGKAALK